MGIQKENKMNNEIFERIKERVSMRDIVEFYGFILNRQHMISCPFHTEKTPSLHIYDDTNSFYCHGCQIGGDSVTFVSKLYQLTPYAAAKKINDDMALGVNFGSSAEKKATPTRREPTTAETQRAFEEWTNKTWLSLNGLYKFLNAYKDNLPTDIPKYTEVSADFENINYLCDLFLRDTDGITSIYKYHKGDIRRFYAKYQQYLPNREE